MTEKKALATREAFGKSLASLSQEFDNIIVLDADLSKSTKSGDFAAVCPERFFNVGIAEQNMAGIAAGLSTCGKIPFFSGFAVFVAGRAFEQIRNSIAYPNLNVKIVGSHGGITVGEDGGTHQPIEDIALMRVLPNMTVIVPADEVSAKWAVRAAAEYYGPVYLRMSRLASTPVYDENQEFHWGQGQLLRPGSDIAIFGCGYMLSECLEAASLLANEGIKAAVADIHTIKPLDKELVISLSERCGAAISVEEHSIIGGLGAAVAETLMENGTFIPFSRVGMEDSFGQSGSPAALLRHYKLDAESIANRAKATLAKK